jgi:uncharacterized repeat protein (TIGR04138 family)
LATTRRMSTRDFAAVIDQIRLEDPRFDKGAYFFVRQALDHTLKGEKLKGGKKETAGRVESHVSGQELLEGIREFALEQYGPMAFALLEGWGLRRCEDFGEIVFHLVDYGVLGKTEQDQREDFTGGYDFREAFLRPFEPARGGAGEARTRLEEAEYGVSGKCEQRMGKSRVWGKR